MITNFPNGVSSFGMPVLGGVAGLPFTGKVYFVDYVNGADGNDGTPTLPMKTVQAAHDKCTAGNNDMVIIVGDGGTAKSQRLTTTLTWSKNATHLIGMCNGGEVSQRARIAPLAATTAFANFMTISASGCLFANFQLWHGFDTGTTSAICCTVSGGRNVFQNVHFAGMGDAASAQNAGSRCVKITGSTGENAFYNCSFGVDTVARTAANADLEFAAGTPRNIFRNCNFSAVTSGGGTAALFILGTGAACMDRYQLFDNCAFINNVKSTSSTMAVAISLTNASPGGLILLKQCLTTGCTKIGDTNGLANTYVDGAYAAATGALGVNPS